MSSKTDSYIVITVRELELKFDATQVEIDYTRFLSCLPVVPLAMEATVLSKLVESTLEEVLVPLELVVATLEQVLVPMEQVLVRLELVVRTSEEVFIPAKQVLVPLEEVLVLLE